MPKLFGEECSPEDSVWREVEGLGASSDPRHRALASNIAVDARVPAPRRTALLAAVTRETTRALTVGRSPIATALDGHLRDRVRFTGAPEFAEPANFPNLVPEAAVPGDVVRLLRVGPLVTPLTASLTSTAASARRLRARCPADRLDALRADGRNWSSVLFSPATPDAWRASAWAVLDWLNEYMHTSPFNPAWCAPYVDLVQRSKDASTWAAATGVSCENDEILIVLRYPATHARQLYRPTQLEAGSGELHFPSPCVAECATGLSMSLAQPPGRPPVRELIHGETPYAEEHIHDVVRATATPYDFTMQRQDHHRTVVAVHPGSDRWMAHAFDPFG